MAWTQVLTSRGFRFVREWLDRVAQRYAPGRLRDFESEARRITERSGPLNRRNLGVREVEVSRIIGSVGRSREFDDRFQPLHHELASRERFRRVLKAMKAGELLPPIELYKLGRDYYVLDGHHRVGAARALGIEMLEADVTLFIPSGDPEAVRLYHERLAFERATGLHAVGAALPGTYRRLLTEVHDYRRKLADAQGQPVDLQLAALQWYARVFLPAFASLRSSGARDMFPPLRHADMLACLFEEARIARLQAEATPATQSRGGD